ncbi:MAG TPA: hypothetical protein VEC36_08580 [Patescibacteria group bacterium]|nr:hypothetical protein [Patescibacteria group bacterium]
MTNSGIVIARSLRQSDRKYFGRVILSLRLPCYARNDDLIDI